MKKFERKWNRKFDENGNLLSDEAKYLVLEGKCLDTNSVCEKHLVIISHTDTDGVTSALNMIMFAETVGTDYSVYMERTSREDMTSSIAKYAVDRVIESHKDNPYKEIEVVITDRMFLSLDKYKREDYQTNVYFSWFDHHSGNVRTREEIDKVIGDSNVGEYRVLTDDEHCGATITYQACVERLEGIAEINDIQLYERNLRAWSYNVNLWDTFLWKKKYTEDDPEYHRGQKFGAIDKVVKDEEECLRILLAFIDSGVSLNSDGVLSWVNDNYSIYEGLVKEAYKKAKDTYIGGFVTYYKKGYDPKSGDSQGENVLFKIALVPSEWIYASAIKEMLMKEYSDTDIVITFHKTGGTVYTGYHIEDLESSTLARHIGEMYGLSGGGHKHAAGFGCRLDKPLDNFSKEENDRLARMLVFDRVRLALDEFIYTNYSKEVYIEWKE